MRYLFMHPSGYVCFSDFNKERGAKYELESLKMQEEVFVTLLKKQAKYPVSKSTSQIIFGNPNADLLISVFSNPHCEPCGRMHKRLRELQKKLEDKACIQYISVRLVGIWIKAISF